MSDTLSRTHFDSIAARYAGATGALDPLYAAVRADFEVVAPRVTGWVDPLSGTFPGRIRLPISIFPTRYELFLARKPRG
ncbi:MAG: hypothetical protein COV48_07165 [Elusimicrobia bacterium CG11_big_fil_rev_8_21_14_0_20_64_6]|nr:MAG: hypothetical protein COV48_07165 [Elusimicrobia bacterium CG11_big_fil_rev_8_21_14_0_20_64_6]